MTDTIESLATDIKYIRKTVDEVKDQAQKTNGRVSRLEKWRAFLAGGMAVITAIVLPIFFMMMKGVSIQFS